MDAKAEPLSYYTKGNSKKRAVLEGSEKAANSSIIHTGAQVFRDALIDLRLYTQWFGSEKQKVTQDFCND